MTRFLIIFLLLGVLGGAFYYFTQQSPEVQNDLLSLGVSDFTGAQPATNVQINSDEILAKYREVKAINIDPGLFTRQDYIALQEIFVDIAEPTQIGRVNPFLPIGVEKESFEDTSETVEAVESVEEVVSEDELVEEVTSQ